MLFPFRHRPDIYQYSADIVANVRRETSFGFDRFANCGKCRHKTHEWMKQNIQSSHRQTNSDRIKCARMKKSFDDNTFIERMNEQTSDQVFIWHHDHFFIILLLRFSYQTTLGVCERSSVKTETRFIIGKTWQHLLCIWFCHWNLMDRENPKEFLLVKLKLKCDVS